MARGGMRIGEVLSLTPVNVDDRRLRLRNPKSGRQGEVVYITRKIQSPLNDYIREKPIKPTEYIFPITYCAAWKVVKKSGKMVGIDLRPHDLRRHAATYASRAGTPIETISKVILRHVDLTTTQRYLGNVNDSEAIQWIENLYG